MISLTNDVSVRLIDSEDLPVLAADEYYGTNCAGIEAKNVSFQTKTKQNRGLCQIFCLGADAEVWTKTIMDVVKFGIKKKIIKPKPDGTSRLFDGTSVILGDQDAATHNGLHGVAAEHGVRVLKAGGVIELPSGIELRTLGDITASPEAYGANVADGNCGIHVDRRQQEVKVCTSPTSCALFVLGRLV